MAFGEIRNSDWRFAAGLQHDIFSPIDPTTLAFSKLAAAGNAGVYRLNASATNFLHISDSSQINSTVGISEPTSTIFNDANLSLIEDNGTPNVEARMSLAMGPETMFGTMKVRPIEMGLSGIVGELRRVQALGPRVVEEVWGGGIDFRAAFSERFGIKGEFVFGQALGEYNGAVFQTLGIGNQVPVRSVGGWGEIYYYIVPKVLRTHFGYGIDDPNDRDVSALQIVRNDAFFNNYIWEVSKQIRVGIEASYRTTGYAALPDNDGFGLQSQFQWRF